MNIPSGIMNRSRPPTDDIARPGTVESLVAALAPSRVLFFLFYAVVATLRLDYFSKRMIDWYASYLR
jgi:hypothetical protein